MAALADPDTYRVDPERAWERLKLRTGNRRQLAIVQAIAAWREREAQRINIPRQRLLKDEQIPEIAALAPDDAEALAKARGISSGFAHGKSGPSLLAAIAEAKAMPEDDLPRPSARATPRAPRRPWCAAQSAAQRPPPSKTTSPPGWSRAPTKSRPWPWTTPPPTRPWKAGAAKCSARTPCA